MESNKRKQIEWITGLKGVCAISVVLLHMLACFYCDAIAGAERIERLHTFNFISFTPVNIIFNGSFSVYIFWIVSGFLIANSWYMYHDMNDMKRKIFNKYFRIILPVIVCSVVAFLMMRIGLYYHEQAGEITGFSFFTNERDFNNMTIVNLVKDLLVGDFFTGRVDIIPPLWTMHVDFYGCILSMIFLLLFGDKKRGWLAHVLYIPILIIKGSTSYVCFLIGNLLARYSTQKQKNNIVGVSCLIVGIFLGAYPPSCVPGVGVYSCIYTQFVEKFNTRFDSVQGTAIIYVIAATLILYGIIRSDILQKLYSNRLFKYLGANSFYIYLIHIPLIYSINAWIFVRLYNALNRYNYSVLISCSITMVGILFVATFFRMFSEKKLTPVSKKIVESIMKDAE